MRIQLLIILLVTPLLHAMESTKEFSDLINNIKDSHKARVFIITAEDRARQLAEWEQEEAKKKRDANIQRLNERWQRK